MQCSPVCCYCFDSLRPGYCPQHTGTLEHDVFVSELNSGETLLLGRGQVDTGPLCVYGAGG
jgi:hypothetical protein